MQDFKKDNFEKRSSDEYNEDKGIAEQLMKGTTSEKKSVDSTALNGKEDEITRSEHSEKNHSDCSRKGSGEEEGEKNEDLNATHVKVRAYILLYPFYPVFIICKYLIIFFGAILNHILHFMHSTSQNRWSILIYQALYGVALCFYGKYFTTATAAIEGYEIAAEKAVDRAAKSSKDLMKHFNMHSTKKEENMNMFQYFSQQSNVFLATTKPEKIVVAFGAICKGLVIILASIKFEFLKTAILSLATAEHCEHVVCQLFEAPLKSVIPSKYWRWIETIIGLIAKTIGLVLAALYEEFVHISSGAVLGATGLVRAVVRIIQKIKTGDHHANLNKTYADEIAGLILGILGIIYQFYFNKKLPKTIAVMLGPLYLLQLGLCGIVGCEEEGEEEEETEGWENKEEI